MSEKKEITIVDAEVVPVTPMTLIQQGIASNAPLEQMERLFDLQVKYEENEAKKAYFKAVAAFKAESIDIIKNKRVSFDTQKGKTEYNHAELGAVVVLVAPLLSRHGLSNHWEYSQPDGKVKVTCFITHELGYSKSTSLEASKDDSGGKNNIQAIGSTTSYLERYTFLAMTGLASREQDDDGRGSAQPVEIEYVTESNVMDLESLIAEVEADKEKFLEYMTIKAKFMIEDIAGIPAELFGFAVKVLEGKRGK